MTAAGESHLPSPTHKHEGKILLVLTLIIGALVGLAVVAFIVLTENLGSRLYPPGSPAWRRILIPIVGSVSTGFLLFRYFPNARGSGIPQTKVALFLRDGYISFRTVLGKFGLCSVSLASGIALGREGPSVQVGAGIASVLARRLGLAPISVKSLVPAGASAALAAAFNTPISAVLFSLEEVMGDMHAPILGSIVLSSATAWIVLHLLLGDEPLFHVPSYQLVHPLEFFFYAVLGVVGGLVSVAFVKLLLWQRKHFLSVRQSMQWFLPGVGGLTVGLIGWFYPQVLGVGYTFVGQALNGQMAVGVMALLVVLKLIATSTCYASGNAGGIFGPSLFIGAMMGGAVGGVAHMVAPDYTGSVGAYALVGMGAAFAGIVRVPMTSVIMIFEVTRDYSIIVPLMIANLISYFLSSKLLDEPIYEALQQQDGIHLPTGARVREALLTVAQAFRADTLVLAATERVRSALNRLERGRGAWPVTDPDGLRGMVTEAQLEEAVQAGREEETLARLVPAPSPLEVLTSESFPHVHEDHPLDLAMQRMADSGLTVLPVVSRSNIRQLEGTLAVADIVAAHRTKAVMESAEIPATTLSGIPRSLIVRGVAVLAGLFLLMGFLNYFFRAQRTGQAQVYYRTANQLERQGRFEEAIEQYRRALSISHSREYRLALALALATAGHSNEATTYLNEVLREDAKNGPANLALARLAAQQGKVDEAVADFQRAASGVWPEKPQENRMRARIEMVEVLVQSGRRAQARTELLAILAQSPRDAALQKQMGRLLLDIGMPKEAATVFRELAQRDPLDATTQEGLGEAAFQIGDYATAREAFRRVLMIDPANQEAAKRLHVCDSIIALDPNARAISAAERYRRSRQLLAKTVDQLATCASGGAVPEAVKNDTQAARAALARRIRAAAFAATADSNLAMAKKLWSERLTFCKAKPASDDAVALEMNQLVGR